MNKVAHYLQEHVHGEVMSSDDALEYFSTDGSVFKLKPSMVVYPRNEVDVRKITRFSWQLAERGKVIPITARGMGTDQSGGALGDGIMVVLPAHMNKILSLDPRKGLVTVQPGINFGKLQQTLQTHYRYLPPYPASMEYCSVGGSIGNNCGGEKTLKYGQMVNYVKKLRVVLANGEVIETGRLSKREVGKRMGEATMEGEIYRTLDALFNENEQTITGLQLGTTKNSAGYNLGAVRQKDGSMDLTPLIVGSQGTLGIITEAQLSTEPYNPISTLVVAMFDDIQKAGEAIVRLRALKPSAMELVDDNLLNFVLEHNPNQLKSSLQAPFPKVLLLVEFDEPSDRSQARLAKKAIKLLEKFAYATQIAKDEEERDKFWKIRHSAAAVIWQQVGKAKALPIIEDGVVPPEQLPVFLDRIYALFLKHGLQSAVWGHAGDANLHIQPFLDLSQTGHRQKVFRLMDEYYQLVLSLGGSTSGEHNDGRLRGSYLKALYGDHAYALFQKVKRCFDPYGTLNPGVKIDVSPKDVVPLLRDSYDMKHLYTHMPRS